MLLFFLLNNAQKDHQLNSSLIFLLCPIWFIMIIIAAKGVLQVRVTKCMMAVFAAPFWGCTFVGQKITNASLIKKIVYRILLLL